MWVRVCHTYMRSFVCIQHAPKIPGSIRKGWYLWNVCVCMYVHITSMHVLTPHAHTKCAHNVQAHAHKPVGYMYTSSPSASRGLLHPLPSTCPEFPGALISCAPTFGPWCPGTVFPALEQSTDACVSSFLCECSWW